MATPYDQDYGETLARWSFPEYLKHERALSWYVWAILIDAALILYSVFTGNFLFLIFLIIVTIIIYLQHKREPQDVDFKITEDGIIVGEKFYPWKEIKDFSIIYEPPEVKNLYFEFKSKIKPGLSIPLEKQDPIKSREILIKYIEEDTAREAEPVSDAIGRILKI